ncbi:DUF982 domain-containing protein [Ochrobactrum soli]|uniref:DUF982 domain-containing protein n=1 Tax=Brucella/Ochrobactrum group TaxID=2826938 RepID=UPI000EF1D6C3|nr:MULTISPECIES: DUF982 domain-containing protein [Brucella]RLL65535.1 DUF982 domain-containing protein [[Ochrobactrum] soli]WHS30024.1 DUF982 domain-containing protein [Brucella sp. NM4]WHT44491.1 DUF982 domain-containing protein [Ochrobactrum sp. SSR]
MRTDLFEKPVSILVGLGLPVEVRNATEAYRFLSEQPASLRNPAHNIALKACAAALRGEIDFETARGLFVAFAKRHDFLVSAGIDPAISQHRNETDRHVR